MMTFNILLALVFGAILDFANGSLVYEKILHKKLLKDYLSDVRPELIFDKPIQIIFDLVIEGVNSLDVRNQVLDISSFTVLEWYDPQLVWNSTEMDGIDSTAMGSQYIWTPDVVLYNTADERPLLHTEIYKTKVKISSNGRVYWTAPTTWKISCNCDITWFPLDKQICEMKFGSFSYNVNQLKLVKSVHMNNTDKLLDGFQKITNGEWNIAKVHSSDENSTFRCCPYPFSTVVVEISLKRMPLYYFLYLFLPLIALILVYVLIFHLDIGQRASYGVTILLSIVVFLLVLSEKLPEKSNDMPLIGLIFIAEFFILVIALPIAEYTGHMAKRFSSPPPESLYIILNCHGKKSDSIINKNLYNPDEDVQLNDMANVANTECHSRGDIDNNKKWRVLARRLDVICTYTFIPLVVIVPLIISGILGYRRPYDSIN